MKTSIILLSMSLAESIRENSLSEDLTDINLTIFEIKNI